MSTDYIFPKRREAWRKQEGKLHSEGVKRVPGSGSGQDKGDNKGERYLVQCKTTCKKQFSLTRRDWDKSKEDAGKEDRLPVMQVQLEDREPLAVLAWEEFVAICEEAGIEI